MVDERRDWTFTATLVLEMKLDRTGVDNAFADGLWARRSFYLGIRVLEELFDQLLDIDSLGEWRRAGLKCLGLLCSALVLSILEIQRFVRSGFEIPTTKTVLTLFKRSKEMNSSLRLV